MHIVDFVAETRHPIHRFPGRVVRFGHMAGLEGPGQVAFWDAGESHESSTDSGMTVIVIELTSIQTTERS